MGPLQWSKDCLDLFIGQNQLLGHGFVIFNFLIVSVTHEWRHKGYTSSEQSENIFRIFQKTRVNEISNLQVISQHY